MSFETWQIELVLNEFSRSDLEIQITKFKLFSFESKLKKKRDFDTFIVSNHVFELINNESERVFDLITPLIMGSKFLKSDLLKPNQCLKIKHGIFDSTEPKLLPVEPFKYRWQPLAFFL